MIGRSKAAVCRCQSSDKLEKKLGLLLEMHERKFLDLLFCREAERQENRAGSAFTWWLAGARLALSPRWLDHGVSAEAGRTTQQYNYQHNRQ